MVTGNIAILPINAALLDLPGIKLNKLYD